MQGYCCVFANLLEHIELPAKLLDYLLRSNKSNINKLLSLEMSSKGYFNFESLYLSKDPGDNLELLNFHHLRFFNLLFVFCFALCLANWYGALWATLTRWHFGYAPIEFIAASEYEIDCIFVNVCMLIE